MKVTVSVPRHQPFAPGCEQAALVWLTAGGTVSIFTVAVPVALWLPALSLAVQEMAWVPSPVSESAPPAPTVSGLPLSVQV